MEIVLNRNINLFKNKNDLEYIKKVKSYKKYFKTILTAWIDETGFDKNLIHSIIFVANKSSYGMTSPNIVNGMIDFIIEISDDIVPYIYEVQDTTEKFQAKSVFQHEIFHCKEILYLYENRLLSEPNPFSNNFSIETTYNFLYERSIKLWSEFYACYENHKINPWHEIPNLIIDVKELDKWIKSITILLNEKYDDIKLTKETINALYTLWYHMISLMAVYMQNKEPLLLKEFQDCYLDYPYTKEYFKSIYDYLSNMIANYPNWISEDNYIEFGKKLLSIFEINGITYTTDDLSDNFIFKKK